MRRRSLDICQIEVFDCWGYLPEPEILALSLFSMTIPDLERFKFKGKAENKKKSLENETPPSTTSVSSRRFVSPKAAVRRYSPYMKEQKEASNGQPSNSDLSKQYDGEGADEEAKGEVRIWKPILKPGLTLVFIGFNPGTESFRTGHYYAHFTNLFWKLLYESGIVTRKVKPEDDLLMPDEYSIGFTDLVSRSTKGISSLTKEEMRLGAEELENRLAQVSPKIVCIVGKGIWEAIYKAKKGSALKKNDFDWGLQDQKRLNIKFAVENVYVVPSTSGLVGGVSRDEKLRLWVELKQFIDDKWPSTKKEADAG